MKNNKQENNNENLSKKDLLIILKYIKACGTSSMYAVALYLISNNNFKDYDSLIIGIGALASFILTTHSVDKENYKEKNLANEEKTKILK